MGVALAIKRWLKIDQTIYTNVLLSMVNIDALAQEIHYSSALAIELPLSYTNHRYTPGTGRLGILKQKIN